MGRFRITPRASGEEKRLNCHTDTKKADVQARAVPEPPLQRVDSSRFPSSTAYHPSFYVCLRVLSLRFFRSVRLRCKAMFAWGRFANRPCIGTSSSERTRSHNNSILYEQLFEQRTSAFLRFVCLFTYKPTVFPTAQTMCPSVSPLWLPNHRASTADRTYPSSTLLLGIVSPAALGGIGLECGVGGHPRDIKPSILCHFLI